MLIHSLINHRLLFLKSKNPSKGATLFGSKAKLSASQERSSQSPQRDFDVLDIESQAFDTYLSEIDEPSTSARIVKSVIVKPPDLFPHSPKRSTSPKNRRSKLNRPAFKSKAWFKGRECQKPHASNSFRTHEPFRLTVSKKSRHVSQASCTLESTSQITARRTVGVTQKTFETRGTQTECTGPCKCSRAVQTRNKRRRIESAENKHIVKQLERMNALKYT